MIRIFACIGLILFACIGPFYIFIALSVLYALRYTAYELIVIMGMMEVLYGTAYTHIPVYTLCTIAGVMALEYLKPRLSLYRQ